jgi:hypothetical protein
MYSTINRGKSQAIGFNIVINNYLITVEHTLFMKEIFTNKANRPIVILYIIVAVGAAAVNIILFILLLLKD